MTLQSRIFHCLAVKPLGLPCLYVCIGVDPCPRGHKRNLRGREIIKSRNVINICFFSL